ncbi:MAG: hypothetical protein COS72_02760 [Candidatus Moranbacteria bacterium CG06_land_8_20_14_3_00_43_56]|nr:MAG: hypothetical protein COS72_02760 [Candidatus Moranbacteria bacterium CG06_land_8_20_14_3_00_43_56]PIV83662.1 MAG: hypothetical protein COW51_03525 [Candidatus Moranbacteria bacterium CG17_big_fil_post_rev_8_21_14_2_50_44_12]PJA85819.1 MAG: hypothetical protein CO142_02705 [Candidatus Moranbacteria bacterium CG_4_9_14_3_um_filter_44_28]
MQFSRIKEKFLPFLIFTKENLRAFEKKEETASAGIRYWMKSGKIIQLKKGLYVLKERWEKESQKDAYLEYIAGKMLEPSYLSFEYVLSKYGILSEPVSALTSATAKTSREFSNALGSFRYYTLAPELFCGYEAKEKNGFPVLEASKAKALFDFLYIRFLKQKPITAKAVEDLRINWENISRKEFERAESYLKFTKNKRVRDIFKIIKSRYYAKRIS